MKKRQRIAVVLPGPRDRWPSRVPPEPPADVVTESCEVSRFIANMALGRRCIHVRARLDGTRRPPRYSPLALGGVLRRLHRAYTAARRCWDAPTPADVEALHAAVRAIPSRWRGAAMRRLPLLASVRAGLLARYGR